VYEINKVSSVQAAGATIAPLNEATVRYDTIRELNMDSKAECDQLNLTHETKTNKKAQLSLTNPRDVKVCQSSFV